VGVVNDDKGGDSIASDDYMGIFDDSEGSSI
jgi:hypothetical protein